MKTEAALLVETGKPLVLARIAMPSLKPGQVLVEIAFSGACGTQLMEIAGAKGEDKWCPHCLGHEGAGTVMWPANLKIVKGWFPESFKGLEEIRWRFVHIDFDLYQPIKTALETLWKPLLPGGIVMVHDYGCYGFPAARRAVDEFCHAIGQLPVELNDRWSTAVIRKPVDPAA